MTEDNTKPTRGAPRSKKSHEAILAAALELAEKDGPQALTIEAVARRAGVGKQTIYRWWPTRIDLLIEVYDAYAPPLKALNVKRSLKNVLTTLFHTYHEGPAGELLSALIVLSQSGDDAQKKFQERFLQPRREAIAAYLFETGETGRRTAQICANLIIAMIWYGLLSDPKCLTQAYAARISALVKSITPETEKSRTHYSIIEGYRSGFSGALLSLHMNYYTPAWGFGQNFETCMARDFGLFLEKYDDSRDQMLRVENDDGEIVGTLVIQATGYAKDVARVRFFVMSMDTQGKGLGNEMLSKAIETCRSRGQRKLFLTTFKELEPACTLYERAGFILSKEFEEDEWGEGTKEVRYDLELAI